MTSMGGRNECRPAEPIRETDIGIAAQHLVEDGDVARLAESEERVRATVVLEVHVRSGVDEHSNGLSASRIHRRGDGRAPGGVPRVDIGTAIEEVGDLSSVAACGGLDQPRANGRFGFARATDNYGDERRADHGETATSVRGTDPHPRPR